MNRKLEQILILLVVVLALTPCYGADEALVAAFLAKRQSLVEENKVDVAALSKAIRAAVTDGERLEREGKYELALERLLDLRKFVLLPELPSFDVQMLSSWLYMKTGDPKRAAEHRARADAMRDVLMNRIGSGKSPETPVQAVMINDIAEWTRIQLAVASDVKSSAHKGHEILAVTYSGAATNNKPALVYFEIDPRVQAKANLEQSLFAPIPIERMVPQHRAFFERAKAKREKFLDDSQFPYLELLERVKMSVAKAEQLES